jgi:hypothetical protein
MVCGADPAVFFLLPMLGEKHPDLYPRFRDCFLLKDDKIAVYTRVGGNNRNQGYGEEELYQHPNYLQTYDDEYDNTYAIYEFSVPEEWKSDLELLKQGKFNETSQAYQDRVRKVYPKLHEKLDELFGVV